MFDAIQNMRVEWILNGVIISIVFGLAAGNYACSLVFRLPRGRLILDHTPYCGTCSTPLQVKDLFPVISAVLLKHRCRYCNTPFPVSHTWTEILVALLFVAAFFKYGFGEEYVLVVLAGIFFITQAAIEANEKKVMKNVMMSALVCGIIFRTFIDHTIFNFFYGAVVTLVFTCYVWRKKIKKVGHIYVPPDFVLMMTAGGACVGLDALPFYAVLMVAVYVADLMVRKMLGVQRPPLSSVTVGVAVTLLMLYPELGFRLGM